MFLNRFGSSSWPGPEDMGRLGAPSRSLGVPLWVHQGHRPALIRESGMSVTHWAPRAVTLGPQRDPVAVHIPGWVLGAPFSCGGPSCLEFPGQHTLAPAPKSYRKGTGGRMGEGGGERSHCSGKKESRNLGCC